MKKKIESGFGGTSMGFGLGTRRVGDDLGIERVFWTICLV